MAPIATEMSECDNSRFSCPIASTNHSIQSGANATGTRSHDRNPRPFPFDEQRYRGVTGVHSALPAQVPVERDQPQPRRNERDAHRDPFPRHGDTDVRECRRDHRTPPSMEIVRVVRTDAPGDSSFVRTRRRVSRWR